MFLVCRRAREEERVRGKLKRSSQISGRGRVLSFQRRSTMRMRHEELARCKLVGGAACLAALLANYSVLAACCLAAAVSQHSTEYSTYVHGTVGEMHANSSKQTLRSTS